MRVLDHGRGFLPLSVVQGKECLVKVACKNMAKRINFTSSLLRSTASRESCVVAGTVLAIREKREAQLVTFGDEDFGHEEQFIVFRSMDWRFIGLVSLWLLEHEPYSRGLGSPFADHCCRRSPCFQPTRPHGPGIKNAAAQEAEQLPKAVLHDATAGGAAAARTVPKTAPAAE